jgi:hypothetical protein
VSTPEAGLRERVMHQIRLDYPPRRSGVLIFGRPASGSTGAGHPDLFGVVLGRYIGLELKMPGKSNKPTELQIQRIKDLRQCGACAWVVRSPLEAIKAIYQTKHGATVMPEDPIDFDDWLKGLELGGTPSEQQVVPAENTIEDAALSAGIEVTTQGSPEMDFDPLPETSGPPSPTLEAELLPETEGDAQNASWLDKGPFAGMSGEQARALADADAVGELVDAQTDVMKAVGDRVTLVFEAVNVVAQRQATLYRLLADTASEVIILRTQMNALLEEIEVKQAVQPVLMNEPLPLDDILPPSNGATPAPAEALKRRRRTKAS